MVRYIVNDYGFNLYQSDILSFERTQTKTALTLEGDFLYNPLNLSYFNLVYAQADENFTRTGLKNLHSMTSHSFKVIYEGQDLDKQDYSQSHLSKITVWADRKIAQQISGLDITFEQFENMYVSSNPYYHPANGYDFRVFAGDDYVTLMDNPDISDDFNAGSGNDIVEGRAGNDDINGGYGNDKLYGGVGNDTLYGDYGSDKLYGDYGNDKLYGDSGADFLYGGVGNDTLYGGDGSDALYGQDGNDYISSNNANYLSQNYVDTGNDRLYGGNGNDSLHAGRNADTLYGDAGDDVLYAHFYGNTTMFGGTGSDKFIFERLGAGSGTGDRDVIKDFQTGDKINLASLFGIDDRNDLSITYNATQKAYIVQDNPTSHGDDVYITVYSDHRLTATDFIF